jgi:hypothetical protein
MPNVVTIPFFLLDSPLKKEDLCLHCFGASSKLGFILPCKAKKPRNTLSYLLGFCKQTTELSNSHPFKAKKVYNRTVMVLGSSAIKHLFMQPVVNN